MFEQYRGSETILVADDEPVVLCLARTILNLHGYQVVTAADGFEALEAHRKTKPIDLLVTDVIMPRMSGPELAHAIKLEDGRFRCLFMSGYSPEQIRDQAAGDVGCDYLRKPFKPAELLEKVRRALDG
jgi:two-component system, cell cycle sensor histidine kinase and response regulator CckA